MSGAWNPEGLFDVVRSRDEAARERRRDADLSGEALVYCHPDGASYVGCVEGAWYRWPAVQDGWSLRRRASEDDADPERELAPGPARLALLLSGVEP